MNLFAVIFFPLLTIVALCYAAATQPASARCPSGTVLLTGVRRNGSFVCWTPGRGVEARSRRGGIREVTTQPAAPVVESRIYCTGGQEPVYSDGVAVGCHGRH